MKFRELKADEIECRIGTVSKNGKGLSLLLYKTARVDADVLDETVGPENWQCSFYEQKGTLFCKVGILCECRDKRSEWVWKDDAGAPSNMEAQKGEASDAFKRACFKWGIGRELYTAPFIWVPKENCELVPNNKGGYITYDRFEVAKIKIENGRIVGLAIRNEKTRRIVYTYVEQGYESGKEKHGE